jgi:hypothetical protein
MSIIFIIALSVFLFVLLRLLHVYAKRRARHLVKQELGYLPEPLIEEEKPIDALRIFKRSFTDDGPVKRFAATIIKSHKTKLKVRPEPSASRGKERLAM